MFCLVQHLLPHMILVLKFSTRYRWVPGLSLYANRISVLIAQSTLINGKTLPGLSTCYVMAPLSSDRPIFSKISTVKATSVLDLPRYITSLVVLVAAGSKPPFTVMPDMQVALDVGNSGTLSDVTFRGTPQETGKEDYATANHTRTKKYHRRKHHRGRLKQQRQEEQEQEQEEQKVPVILYTQYLF